MVIEQGPAPGWQVIGHRGPQRFLQRALTQGRLGHAFLITGPSQVGRKALAMGLARGVNCAGPDPRPCGSCQQCIRVTRGLHADVRIIDRATPIRGVAGANPSDAEEDSRRTAISIHHVREMQHESALNPFEGRAHVFILDEAEDMTEEACNCLLKTLEEPAKSVLIILVATAASALPETVVSRCQRFELRPVPTEEIESGLVELAKAEPGDAARLARLSEGRPGWAVAAMTDPMIIDRYRQSVQRVLDATVGDWDHRFRYARTLATTFRSDREAVLRELELWARWWRDVLLVQHGLQDRVANADRTGTLASISEEVDAAGVASAVEAARDTIDALERNAAPQLALEVFMLGVPRISAERMPDSQAAPAGGREEAR